MWKESLNTLGLALLAAVLLGGGVYYLHRYQEKDAMPAELKPLSADCEFATLGGGCFWCIEAVFEEVKGVERVESGYAGGPEKNPTYQQVCNGTTGHAEVIQVAFDPKVISYREILQIFFVVHDPTTLNYQGNDRGTQYRSAVFYQSPEQKKNAEGLIAELDREKFWPQPIVTQVAPLDIFYRAEGYHQSYFRNNPNQGYCRAVIPPKLAKLRKHFLEKVKK